MTSTILYFIFAIGYVTACIKMVPPDMEGMPVTDSPVTNAPVTNEPVTEEPVTNEPVTDEAITSEPVTNEPVTTEPVTNEPVTTEPVTSEPLTNEPVTDEPITDEPVTDEPVTDEPITDAPITDAPGDCNTCELSTLFDPAAVTTANYYFPNDQYIIPTSGSCVSYDILCYSQDNFDITWIKDIDGNADNEFSVEFIPYTCDDEGKWVYRGRQIVAFWCAV